MKYFLICLISLNVFGQQVFKNSYKNKVITLKIIQVDTDSFQTYTLTNQDYIEMQLVCAKNRVYDNNKLAMIRLKNFWGEWAQDFTIANNQICLDMGRFIENARAAVDERRPFYITLDRRTNTVSKIIYPDIDPLSLTGDIEDLFPKKKNLENFNKAVLDNQID